MEAPGPGREAKDGARTLGKSGAEERGGGWGTARPGATGPSRGPLGPSGPAGPACAPHPPGNARAAGLRPGPREEPPSRACPARSRATPASHGGRGLPPPRRAAPRARTVLAASPVRLSHRKSVMAAVGPRESRAPLQLLRLRRLLPPRPTAPPIRVPAGPRAARRGAAHARTTHARTPFVTRRGASPAPLSAAAGRGRGGAGSRGGARRRPSPPEPRPPRPGPPAAGSRAAAAAARASLLGAPPLRCRRRLPAGGEARPPRPRPECAQQAGAGGAAGAGERARPVTERSGAASEPPPARGRACAAGRRAGRPGKGV